MSTLNEAIQAEIASLEAKAETLKASFSAELGLVQNDIDQAKAHLSGLTPWLDKEVSAAKEAIAAFFAKLGL
jgi:hypothetical protein